MVDIGESTCPPSLWIQLPYAQSFRSGVPLGMLLRVLKKSETYVLVECKTNIQFVMQEVLVVTTLIGIVWLPPLVSYSIQVEITKPRKFYDLENLHRACK